MAVYLSTSDEMIPIFISEAMPIGLMLKILGIKLILGIFWGVLIDFIVRKLYKLNLLDKEKKGNTIDDEEISIEICEDEHCHCHEQGIIKASLVHTINITIYIFIITLIINVIIGAVGEDKIEMIIKNNIFLGPIVSSLIGLIPNCAASVIITNLYIENVINMASLVAGLLTGAGVGLIVLFRTNKNIKQNLIISALMYFIGVTSGLILQLII